MYSLPYKPCALLELRLQGIEGMPTFSSGSSPFSLGAPMWVLAILAVTLMGKGFYFRPPPELIQMCFQNLPKSLFFPCTVVRIRHESLSSYALFKKQNSCSDEYQKYRKYPA